MSPLPIRAGLIAASLLALGGCGHRPAEAEGATAEAATPAPTTRRKTVFDDQLKALDKAKAVEKQLQEDKDKADQAINDAGG